MKLLKLLIKNFSFKALVSLGKPKAYTAEATQRSLPVVRLNLRVLRVRDDDEGLEVRWEQRVSQVDVNPVYCVFDHL